MSLAHERDPYAKLWALCNRNGWTLGVGRLHDELSLRVTIPDKPYQSCAFRSGGENDAASELLHRLSRATA